MDDWTVHTSSFGLRIFIRLVDLCTFFLKMFTTFAISLLVAACPLALSAPLAGSGSALRLIKTSEVDIGQWVTEQDKFDRFTSKNLGFIDITDIKVSVLNLELKASFFELTSEYRTRKCCLFYPFHLQKPPSLPVQLLIRPRPNT